MVADIHSDSVTLDVKSYSEMPGSWFSSFGLFDVLVLSALLFATAFFLFFRRKKIEDETSVEDSFTFSPPTAQDESDDSFINKMKSSGRSVVVFYGSQTGTAEEFAGRLVKEATRYGLKGMVADPEECDMEDLSRLVEVPKSLAIFCMATYGEGDPTDNAQAFFEWLENASVCLEGLQFSVFGLGNKTYEHYNEMAIYVDKRLSELGAKRVFELGLGDDDGNLEEDFISWKEKFWSKVCEEYGLDATGKDVSMRQYKLVMCEAVSEDKLYHGEVARLGSYSAQRPPYDAKNPFLAQVVMNRGLQKGNGRLCMHIEFDITDSRIRYESGDHVAVFPTNNPETVEHLGKLLGVNLDDAISLVSLDDDTNRKNPFPCPCTYRTALLHYLDITSIPFIHVLKEIAEYATNPEERDKLKLMCQSTPEGKALYHEWIHNSCRNIVHVLEDMPSLKPPLDHLCELLPRLQARYYSISSSPKVSPNRIHITAVLISYSTSTNRINRGVATSWFSGMKTENNNQLPANVPIYVRKSQFRLPAQPQTPVIMIGPGTGLAPFRGFLQERQFQKEQGKPIGETILYFGCRRKEEDFLYEDELAKFVENGTLSKLHVAFSRDQEQKVYVTHLLRENAEEVWKIIGEQNGHVYVCGDAKHMAKDVHNIIKDICIEKGAMTDNQALEYVKKMEFQKRYSADVWS